MTTAILTEPDIAELAGGDALPDGAVATATGLIELLTGGDAADELELSAQGVLLLIRSGQLKPIARTRKGWPLFSAHEIARLKQQRRMNPRIASRPRRRRVSV